jgi:galactitol-specific phosphotransferase system IIC component
MPRVTRANVDSLASFVSSALNGLEVRAQGRNGYIGLDLYDSAGCVRTLTCGTKREVLTYLEGMRASLAIVGRDV